MPVEDLDDDDSKPGRLIIIFYLVVGILAIIGLFSIIGTILSGVYLILRLALVFAAVAVALYILKAVFWNRRDKAA